MLDDFSTLCMKGLAQVPSARTWLNVCYITILIGRFIYLFSIYLTLTN